MRRYSGGNKKVPGRWKTYSAAAGPKGGIENSSLRAIALPGLTAPAASGA
jgi:hypothetical protein